MPLSWLTRKVGGYLLSASEAAGSTLLDGLVSYWALDEVSGVRYDSVGENHLTDNNTVLAACRGPEGTVAHSFKANAERLTTTYAMPTTYSVMTWVQQPADITDQYGSVVAFKNSVLCDLSFGNLRSSYANTHFVNLAMFDGAWRGTGEHFAAAVGAPHMIVGTCDNTAKELKVYVNGVQKGTTATFVNTAGDYGTTDLVSLGASGAQFSQVSSANWSVRQGPTAVWSRVLTAQEQTDLLALGNGLRYADLPAGLTTGLVSWWELDEVSGVRYDSHGSNDLTDNNTVGSATAVAGAMNGNAASFVSANNEYLNSSAISLDLSSGWTVSLWVKPLERSAGDWNPTFFFEKNHAWNAVTGPIQISMVTFGDDVYFLASSGDGTGVANAHSYSLSPKVWASEVEGKWLNLYAQYDPLGSPQVRMYLNYSVEATGHSWLTMAGPPYNAVAQPINVNYTVQGGTGQKSCVIDEVALWDRVLTEDERAELYALGAGKYYPFPMK